jgi:hypothetical protein
MKLPSRNGNTGAPRLPNIYGSICPGIWGRGGLGLTGPGSSLPKVVWQYGHILK